PRLDHAAAAAITPRALAALPRTDGSRSVKSAVKAVTTVRVASDPDADRAVDAPTTPRVSAAAARASAAGSARTGSTVRITSPPESDPMSDSVRMALARSDGSDDRSSRAAATIGWEVCQTLRPAHAT